MSDEKKYPIAEIFHSPQGEGLYAGTLMTFVRFAGCSVGKRMTDEQHKSWQEKNNTFGATVFDMYRTIAPYTEECCSVLGTAFLCDTNFQTKEVLSIDEILGRVPPGVEHICFTGGEPLDQPLTPLLKKIASETAFEVHIETSGTVDIRERAYPEYSLQESTMHDGGWLWITVSPKRNALPKMMVLADEIKLLVDESFDIDKVPRQILEHPLVWIQPINYEFRVSEENMKRCLDLQKLHPTWRISSQSHKIWNVR